MKTLLTLLFLSTLIYAEYKQGKIDMHGGKGYGQYEKKENGFKTMGLSTFLDTNSSKKETKKDWKK